MVFDAPLSGLMVSQVIEGAEETWEAEAGLRGVYPFAENWALTASVGVAYQQVDVDADVVHVTDLFGDLTTIRARDSGDGDALGLRGALGIQFQYGGLTLEGSYEHGWNQSVIDIRGTTNGDNILNGERFTVGTSDQDVGFFGLEASFRF
jgi:hypothetical protein